MGRPRGRRRALRRRVGLGRLVVLAAAASGGEPCRLGAHDSLPAARVCFRPSRAVFSRAFRSFVRSLSCETRHACFDGRVDVTGLLISHLADCVYLSRVFAGSRTASIHPFIHSSYLPAYTDTNSTDIALPSFLPSTASLALSISPKPGITRWHHHARITTSIFRHPSSSSRRITLNIHH